MWTNLAESVFNVTNLLIFMVNFTPESHRNDSLSSIYWTLDRNISSLFLPYFFLSLFLSLQPFPDFLELHQVNIALDTGSTMVLLLLLQLLVTQIYLYHASAEDDIFVSAPFSHSTVSSHTWAHTL